jgi:hydroxyacylglutathione hydrolase
VLFRQFVNSDLGCASYLVGCEAAGEAVVVDPPYAVEEILAEASRLKVRVVRTLETHTHADHVSGHGRLALGYGIPVSIHALAGVDYPHDPMVDGDEINVGNVTLRCAHTPGHRPEHCCFTVVDYTRAEEPWLVLTGDSLFVGDTARPDLAVGGIEGATALHASLGRLLALHDGVEVYPGHVAGSLCGKAMSSKESTTIGFERRFNPMLAFSDVSAFIASSASVSAPKPPNLERIVAVNSGLFLGDPATVPETDDVAPGSQPLDVRDVATFLATHSAGSLNIPVAGTSFATKAGFILDASRPVHVTAATREDAERAIRGLHSVAFFELTGFTVAPLGTESVTPVSVDELQHLLAGNAVQLIDVRDENELDHGVVPGSVQVPYRFVATVTELPSDRPLVTICETGARAAIAASVLRARGYDARPVIDGGIGDLDEASNARD